MRVLARRELADCPLVALKTFDGLVEQLAALERESYQVHSPRGKLLRDILVQYATAGAKLEDGVRQLVYRQKRLTTALSFLGRP